MDKKPDFAQDIVMTMAMLALGYRYRDQQQEEEKPKANLYRKKIRTSQAYGRKKVLTTGR